MLRFPITIQTLTYFHVFLIICTLPTSEPSAVVSWSTDLKGQMSTGPAGLNHKFIGNNLIFLERHFCIPVIIITRQIKLPTIPHTHMKGKHVCIIAKMPSQCFKRGQVAVCLWSGDSCPVSRVHFRFGCKLIQSQPERKMSVRLSMRSRGGPRLPSYQTYHKFTSWVWPHHRTNSPCMCVCVCVNSFQRRCIRSLETLHSRIWNSAMNTGST